jgi:hypothetical protein
MKKIILNTDDAVMNRVVNDIDGNFREMQSDVDDLGSEVGTVSDTVDTIVVDQTVPGNPGISSVTESGYIVDGVLFSEVTVTYTAPKPLGNFKGVYFVVKNYRGSAQLVKESEHNFSGLGGGSASFNVTLQRTGETITIYLVPKNNFGVSPQDWTTAPSATVVLDGNASAPNAPTGLAASSTNIGIALSWTQNSELNLAGYKIYRGTTNVFGSATLLNNVGVSRSGAPSYFDATGSYVTVYYYWVTAVNTAAQESSASASVSAVSGGSAVTGFVAQGNFGLTEASTSINIYWDGTNGSNLFTLRLADGTTKSVPSGSTGTTGLSAGVTYKFYPFYNVLVDGVNFVVTADGVGSQNMAYPSTSTAAVLSTASSELNYPGRIALASPSISITTTGGGGGGGTGGGGGDPDCIAPWMSVETKDGEVLLEDLQVGDWVSCPEGWSEVKRIKKPEQKILVKIKIADGHSFECSPTHPLALANGKWKYAGELKLGDYLVTEDGASEVSGWELVELNYTSILPALEPYHEFFCNGVLTHNSIYNKY